MSRNDKKTRAAVAPVESTTGAPADVAPETPTDTLPGVSVAPVSDESPAVYVVAPGKSMTSSRGVLSAGDRVTRESFAPGVFDILLHAGKIVRA